MEPRRSTLASTTPPAQYGAIATDTIVLDTVAPSTPTQLREVPTTTIGCEHHDHVHVDRGRPTAPLGGYRVYKRLITSTGSYSLVCDTGSTTCSDTHKKTDTYEYYIVAYDLATNVSAGSTPHLTG